jgi:hypothetical protein
MMTKRGRQYVATINVPGYLPHHTSDDTFGTVRQAWDYLADFRVDEEDAQSMIEGSDPSYSATVNVLQRLAEGEYDPSFGVDENGEGSVRGVAIDGDDSFAVVYSVTEAT